MISALDDFHERASHRTLRCLIMTSARPADVRNLVVPRQIGEYQTGPRGQKPGTNIHL